MDMQIHYHLFAEKYKTKYSALYYALKDAIVDGRLPYRCKLPSSRELAALYMVSRGTVNQVYEMLGAEGYVDSFVGSGTYVAFQAKVQQKGENPEGMGQVRLSEWGQRLEGLDLRTKAAREIPAQISFDLGLPDTEQFPTQIWHRYLYAEVRGLHQEPHQEAFQSQGILSLREAIAHYLKRARGMEASTEDIVIVNGSMQAIALLIQLLVNPGEPVVLEMPGYSGIRRALEAVGGVVIPAVIDRSGIQCRDWEAKLLFVTPTRQFPTGAVLSMERRQEILQWASHRGAIIIEDDYDSEFRHRGRPLEPLKVMDKEGRVAYIGTFSKTMMPELRVGYVVLPPGLQQPFAKAKQLFEPHPAALIEQRALAAFMISGQYERHLRRMKRVYSRRYELLLKLLNDSLGHLFETIPSDAGLHIFVWWRRSETEWIAYRSACIQAGVLWSDTSSYFVKEARPSACFGFSHLSEQQIAAGIDLMRKTWKGSRKGYIG